MKNWIVATVLLLVGIIAFACGGSQVGKSSVVAGTIHPEGNFDGVFYSAAYGRLEITASGNAVKGLYEGERHFGQIEGTIDGNLMRFSWVQWKTDLNGKSRVKEGLGYFVYEVDKEGTTDKPRLVHWLRGEWGYDEDDAGNKWEAVRLPSKSKKHLTPHEMNQTTDTMDAEYSASAGFSSSSTPAHNVSPEPSAVEDKEQKDNSGSSSSLDDIF